MALAQVRHALSSRLTGSLFPSPQPGTSSPVDADLVTPGLWGFATLFASAVAVYFLGRSMARRVQRVNQRARLEQARGGVPSPGPEGQDPAADPDPLACTSPAAVTAPGDVAVDDGRDLGSPRLDPADREGGAAAQARQAPAEDSLHPKVDPFS
jgi:hypothetical protein